MHTLYTIEASKVDIQDKPTQDRHRRVPTHPDPTSNLKTPRIYLSPKNATPAYPTPTQIQTPHGSPAVVASAPQPHLCSRPRNPTLAYPNQTPTPNPNRSWLTCSRGICATAASILKVQKPNPSQPQPNPTPKVLLMVQSTISFQETRKSLMLTCSCGICATLASMPKAQKPNPSLPQPDPIPNPTPHGSPAVVASARQPHLC